MVTSLFVAAFAVSLAIADRTAVSGPQLVQLATAAQPGDTVPRNTAATAVRARPGAPHLDGRLDDPAWALAPTLGAFTQRDPNEGQPATERTDVRVVFTDDALYVGVRAFDSQPGRIAAQLTRRDQGSPSDWIAIGIDSYFDRRTAFVFQVNPAGVKRDSYLFNDSDEDDSWDAVWDVATTRDGEGWTAEFRIPFSQLRFASTVRQFGFQVQRVINRNNENSFWRPIPKNGSGIVSYFGTLEGIEGIRPPRRLELLPYSVGRGSRFAQDGANPFRTGSEAAATIGGDLKYGVTSNITLDLTINPDFGQVEADPAVVNLSAFESFFPERRPFFTEGVNLFRFGLSLGDGDGANEQLFYSRRIGRRPQGDADPRGGFAENVDHSSILGAAKLSGKTPGGWSIGLLGAVTAEERAGVRDSLGSPAFDVVEPRTSYVVGRLARDFRGGHTVLGMFTTALHRDLPAGMEWLRRDALSVGLDFNHRFANGAYRFTTKVIGTTVRGDSTAIIAAQESPARYYQRPDNDYSSVDSSATSLSGFMAQATIGKETGLWRWSTGFDTRSPGFEVNDMGYMRQADYLTQFGWLSRRWIQPGRLFRRAQINFNQWSGFNYGGDRTELGGNFNANFTLLNYWAGGLGLNRNTANWSNELRGGPLIRRGGGWNAWAWFESDSRKALRGWWNGWFFVQDEDAVGFYGINGGLAWRASSNVDLNLSPNLNWGRDEWQYLSAETVNGTTEYLFGQLRQTTLSMQLRANLTFTPTLTLQVYAEPFYAVGRFPAIKRVANPRGELFADRFETFGPTRASRDSVGDLHLDVDGNGANDVTLDNPDFSRVSLRSNVVLRWEYRAGSTVFLVWQQGRGASASNGQFDLGAARRSLVDTRPENVFLVKVNYWLSL